MGELPHFRTAVGGFHKSDVSEYIAKIAKEHQNQLQEKDKEIQQLRQQLDEARDQLSQQAAAPKPEAALTPAPEAPAESQEETLDRLELEAYRRAEAAERIASQRAKKLYEALGDICNDARAQLENADSAARNSITAMELQLQTLEDSCDTLTAALSQARQQLLDMDAMIPDPAEGLEEV